MASPSQSQDESQKMDPERWTELDSITIPDPEVEALRHAAIEHLVSLGVIFRNHAGKTVSFDELEFDLQVGILMHYTYPVDDDELRKAYRRGVVEEQRIRREWVAQMDGDGRGNERREDSVLLDGTSGESEGTSVRLRTPYEILTYVDTDRERVQLRRRQPSIERNWHVSKTKRGNSLRTHHELGIKPWRQYSYFGPSAHKQHRAVWRTETRSSKSHIERVLE